MARRVNKKNTALDAALAWEAAEDRMLLARLKRRRRASKRALRRALKGAAALALLIVALASVLS